MNDVLFDTSSNSINYEVAVSGTITFATPPTLDLVVEKQPDGSSKLVFDAAEENLAKMRVFYYSLDDGDYQ